jgi:hypothetical protein
MVISVGWDMLGDVERGDSSVHRARIMMGDSPGRPVCQDEVERQHGASHMIDIYPDLWAWTGGHSRC